MRINRSLLFAGSLVLAAASGVFLITVSPSFGQSRDEEAREVPVQLSKVPKAARDAAQKALGVAPTVAKIVSGTNPQEYELEARNSAGKEIEVHVLANGKVLKTEREEESTEDNDRDE